MYIYLGKKVSAQREVSCLEHFLLNIILVLDEVPLSSEPVEWSPFPGFSLQLLQDFRTVSKVAYSQLNLYFLIKSLVLLIQEMFCQLLCLPAELHPTGSVAFISFCLLGYLYLTEIFRTSWFYLFCVYLSVLRSLFPRNTPRFP